MNSFLYDTHIFKDATLAKIIKENIGMPSAEETIPNNEEDMRHLFLEISSLIGMFWGNWSLSLPLVKRI
jgi:hypothetical protein